jgi:hypothetical protein
VNEMRTGEGVGGSVVGGRGVCGEGGVSSWFERSHSENFGV